MKSISKGKYKKFLPAENYITIQKIKYGGNNIIGAERGYVLEIDEKNPFVNDEIAQSILLKMQGFTFIPYTYQATESDFAIDVGDMFDISNTNNAKYQTFVMGNSWEFAGAISQTWQAKGENELNNSYTSKGPISKQLENIVKEQIPNIKEEAIQKATELLTQFNGGYVVKKDGELYISDNEDIDKAQHLWRWNINGLGYSSKGINGPYGLAITMDGKIVADFITTGTLSADVIKANSIGGAKIQKGTITADKIATGAITADMITTGTMSAERINGGTLKLGGNNNTNGSIQVVDASGKSLVNISKDGLILSNGTKLIGGAGILSEFKFGNYDWSQVGYETDLAQGQNVYSSIDIPYLVPSNFEIIKAVLTIKHCPVKWGYSTTSIWGYCRNIGAYILEDNIDYYREVQLNSESFSQNEVFDTEINLAFGSSGFTAKTPSNNSHVLETKESIDIALLLNSKKSGTVQIRTRNSIPAFKLDVGDVFQRNCLQQTGAVKAMLNIIGYVK